MTNIYTDLDTLLDTRLGLLSMIDESLTFELTNSDYYFNRLTDEFKYINSTVFKRLFKNRDDVTLKKSYYSKMIENIKDEIDLDVVKSIEKGLGVDITITINTYPYTLSEKTQDKLSDYIKIELNDLNINVNTINKDITELTLKEVDNTYNVMFMYEGVKWLTTQVLKNSGTAPLTTLVVPALLDKPLKENNSNSLEEVFSDVVTVSQQVIKLEFMNIKEFCKRSKES